MQGIYRLRYGARERRQAVATSDLLGVISVMTCLSGVRYARLEPAKAARGGAPGRTTVKRQRNTNFGRRISAMSMY
jgi:hypothetical protein